VSEIAEVLSAIESLRDRGEKMALATIVAVKGSTYRRPGARLLVAASGEMVGNISGGCLEGDVAEVAQVVMVDGEPRIASFDLTSDDEAVGGGGLGSSPGVERGARLLVDPEGKREGTLGWDSLDDAAGSAALEQLAAGRSEVRELPGARAFVEVLEPPLQLLVCGAGHDVIPLVKTASDLGWKVVVADQRERFLTTERFRQAAGFVHVERPEDAASRASLDDRTYVMVMSHNYLRDKDYLRGFLGSGVAYIGLLGPRVRTERLLDELRREGVEPSAEDRDKMFGPAGLDIGSDGPEEIAQAIVSEILAVRRGRRAGFLRERPGPIHGRTEDRGAWR
jgi:xanthine dehydrogenase accessory factor